MNQYLRALFLGYFVLHIPITILIDLQGLYADYYPDILRNIVIWYCNEFGDFLMQNPPTWFQSFLLCEMIFQLPFFFIAIYGLYYGKNWLRTPSIAYAAHVSTTVFAIISEFMRSQILSTEKKILLTLIYCPFLLIPSALGAYMCITEYPFRNKTREL